MTALLSMYKHLRNIVEYIHKHLPIVSLSVACFLWVIAQFVLPLSTMIRALFIPIGVALSVPFYYITTTRPRMQSATRGASQIAERTFMIDNSQAVKGLTSLALLSIAATTWFNSRFLPVFVFLVIGYMIVFTQLWSDPTPNPKSLLFEAILLLIVPVLAVYLTTDIFFGGGDILVHIRAIDSLFATGTIAGIEYAGVSYRPYPGFHLLMGTLAEVTSLPTYDAIVLAGMILIGTFLLFTYAAVSRLFESKRVALGSTLGVTLLSIVAYYTIYFFPQSMAVVLLSEGVYFYTFLRTTDGQFHQRYVGLTIVLVAIMVLTHHLTFLLFGIAVGILLVIIGFRKLLGTRNDMRYISVFPVLLACVTLITYWVFSSSIFLNRFINAFASQVLGVGTSGSEPVDVMFDVASPNEIWAAITWVAGFDGFYHAMVLALIALTAYELIDFPNRYREQLTFLLAGLLFAGFLLPLPMPIPFFDRFQWTIVLFAVIPFGVALVRLGRVRDSRSLIVVLLLVALLGGSSAFVGPMANDIDSLSGNERKLQVAYTDGIYYELGSSGHFVDNYADTPVTTRNRVLRAIRSTGSSYEDYQNIQLKEDGLTAPSGILLLQEDWTDHTVTTAEGGSFTVSEERFNATIASRNKIYTTGEVHGLWQQEDYRGVFGP